MDFICAECGIINPVWGGSYSTDKNQFLCMNCLEKRRFHN